MGPRGAQRLPVHYLRCSALVSIHGPAWGPTSGYLELALWGGSFILAGEHLLHGEVSPYPPFLTAAGEGPEAVQEMLTEMGTVGVTMLAAIVLAWAVGVFIVDFVNYKKHKKAEALEVK